MKPGALFVLKNYNSDFTTQLFTMYFIFDISLETQQLKG